MSNELVVTEPYTREDPMGLWSRVSKTDPETTKKVSQRGGFTAICAQSQIKSATSEFGPFGQGWYLESEDFKFLDGGICLYQATLVIRGRGATAISSSIE